MKYEDELLTITISRGDLAATIGERGRMVTDWAKLQSALEYALRAETPNRDDGHTALSAVGELLLDVALDRVGETFSGIDSKPNSGPDECWPSGQLWFDGQ